MKKPALIIFSLLFIAHQLTQKVWGIPIPLADSYLDPLLCMPLLLSGYTYEQRWLTGRPRLRALDILVTTTLLAILFEWGFPRWSARFTADIWDVVAYFTGSGLFFLLRR